MQIAAVTFQLLRTGVRFGAPRNSFQGLVRKVTVLLRPYYRRSKPNHDHENYLRWPILRYEAAAQLYSDVGLEVEYSGLRSGLLLHLKLRSSQFQYGHAEIVQYLYDLAHFLTICIKTGIAR
jgi:hypothetical protein